MKSSLPKVPYLYAAALLLAAPLASAQSTTDDLVKATANPVAAMISLPMQSNWEKGYGPGDQTQYTMNVQPVIPFKVNEEWNLVTRTIVPLVHQPAMAVGQGDAWGVSDTVMTLMLSPSKVSKIIWGAGPVFLLPTASKERLGGEKWGIGPSGVILVQEGAWTYGGLANHIWSFAGSDSRSDIKQTYSNPFVTYALGSGWSATMQADYTYNWEAASGKETTLAWTPVLAKVTTIGTQAVSIGLGYRHYSKTPNGSQPDKGVRLVFNFLFPK
jgi:hypothetical protein